MRPNECRIVSCSSQCDWIRFLQERGNQDLWPTAMYLLCARGENLAGLRWIVMMLQGVIKLSGAGCFCNICYATDNGAGSLVVVDKEVYCNASWEDQVEGHGPL